MRKGWHEIKAQAGWQGVVGILLLCAAGMAHFLAVGPLERQNAAMHERIEAALAESGGRGGGASQQGKMGTFIRAMPGEKDVTDVMASIYATADASGVQVRDASFHLEKADGTIVGYVMDFPMVGEYSNIRTLVSHILAREPYVALDQIDFKRDTVRDAKLRANVRFTLFLRKS